MKTIGLILKALTVFALLSGVAWADCEADCDGPFKTCMNICRQTTKEDSPEAAKCADHCFHGVSGCVKKCEAKNKQSENDKVHTIGHLAAAEGPVARDNKIVHASNCIEKGLACVLNGTPCCEPYECKGKFPITTCK